MPRTLRFVALLTLIVLLAGAGCRRGRPRATEAPETPTPTPGGESLGEFQLVATVEQAMLTVRPDVDLELIQEPQVQEGTSERVAAGVDGVMRLRFEAFSDVLRDRCAADEGDRFNVYWTPDSLFDEFLVQAASRMEDLLDGRRLGIIGTAYSRPGAGELELDQPSPAPTTSPTAATPSPTPQASPGVSTGEGEERCVLVAEQIGTSATGELPTPRPTRRATPTPRRTATPRPTSPVTGTGQS